MSFIPVLQYGAGLGVFGFIYWILNSIRGNLVEAGVHENTAVFSFLTFLWAGLLVIYLLFGGIWMIRKYNEDQYNIWGR